MFHDFAYETFTLFGLLSQNSSAITLQFLSQSSTPIDLRHSVWPPSFSLAATQEIDFSFSSCRYLDVSVHDVSLLYTIYSYTDD